MNTIKRARRMGYNPRCRNRCRSRTLLDRTDRYEIWLCTTCDDRRTVGVQQLSLFDEVPAVPEQQASDD